MKTEMETLQGLRYKLLVMGVPISGPSLIYGYNMSVIHKTQRPESTLKKFLNSICCHSIRVSMAMKEILTGHVPLVDNPADICTKYFLGGANQNQLIGKVLHKLLVNVHK